MNRRVVVALLLLGLLAGGCASFDAQVERGRSLSGVQRVTFQVKPSGAADFATVATTTTTSATWNSACLYWNQFCIRNSGWVSVTVHAFVLNRRGNGPGVGVLRNVMGLSFQTVFAVPETFGSSCASPCGNFSLPASSAARADAYTGSLARASRYVCSRSAAASG